MAKEPELVLIDEVLATPEEKPGEHVELQFQATGDGSYAGLNPTGLPTPHSQHPHYDPLGGNRPKGFLGVRPEPPRPDPA